MTAAPTACWQPEAERMDREELEQLQLERLEATLARIYRNVPFYRRKFDEVGFNPDELRSIADLRRLPFTTRDDLRENYPYGLFAVPLRDVVRLHASSGAASASTVIGYTRNDVKTWSDLVARVLVAGGVTKDDVVQIAFDYGLFTGAFGFHYGAERLGASVIPISSGNTTRQIRILQDYKTTALVATPSYALHLANALIEAGVNRNALPLRHGLFSGEPWSEATRVELEEKLKLRATDNYGVSEVMGPGVSGECLEKDGLHLHEDHFLVELVDPGTLQPARPGDVGELVLTTLTKEAFPVVRYRTRDLVSLVHGRCPCGRTSVRMSRVKGRTDDMLILKGVSVFPAQVEEVLRDVEGTEPRYQIVLERRGALDHATVLVEMSESIFFDEMRKQTSLLDRIQQRLASDLGVSFEVKLVQRKTLAPGTRVVDRRKV